MRDGSRGILGALGRASGLAGGLTALALWLMFNATDGVNWVSAGMTVLAVIAVLAAWSARPVLLLITALLSLLPVGLYLLGTPSIYAGIGLANVLCVAGGTLLLLARRGDRGRPAS